MITIKRFGLAIVAALLLVTPAYAYTPPPAGNLAVLLRPKIQIQLPPRLIMTPDKLFFPNSANIFTFNTSTNQFDPPNGGGGSIRVSTEIANNGTAGAAYYITIRGFKKNEVPNPKDLRLTFKEPVSKANIDTIESFLKANSIATASLTGPGCTIGTQAYICLKTITKARVPARVLPDAVLRQTIPLKGIFVEGNVGALKGSLENFNLIGNSLALGGKIINVNGGTEISNYPVDSRSTLDWNNISSSLNAIYDRRSTAPAITTIENPYKTYSFWHLNSADNRPTNNNSTSFSSPPEGKLWNIVVSGTSFSFGDVNTNAIVFNGAGTLVFSSAQGPVNITIHNHLSCAAGTRLGIITQGNINFVTDKGDTSLVDCGAYASLGGSINLAGGTVHSGNVTGIFVAKGNITLPNPNQLQSIYQLRRDNVFGSNPTVLFKDLLKIVFVNS